MTTPAEPISTTPLTPVATAVPVTSLAGGRDPSKAVKRNSPTEKEDYFQPLTFTQCLRRFLGVYLGHLDTFLTITALVSLPVLVGYPFFWDLSRAFLSME